MDKTAKNTPDNFVKLHIKESFKTLREISSRGKIDLFHVNCAGCEWEMFENIIENGLHKRMKVIQFATHFFPKIEMINTRYCNIREALKTTHKLEWGEPFAWERWVKKKKVVGSEEKEE